MVTVTRPIDQLGRVVIPKEIRRTLEWKTGTKLDIFGTENGVMLTTHEEATLLGKVRRLRASLDPAGASRDVLYAMDNLVDILANEEKS